MPTIDVTAWPFSTFHHVNVLVDDMPGTEAFLRQIGIPIFDYPWRDGWTEMTTSLEVFKELGYKRALIGNVHFQFMSAGPSESSHKEFIKKFEKRVYSVGFLVSNVDTAEQELMKRGLKVLKKGRRSDGFGYTYFDTFEKLGINICLRQNAKDMINGP
jgi:hypothetical protein